MALEIERRFLVAGEAWRPLVAWSQSLEQGYLLASPQGPTLRVRSSRASKSNSPGSPVGPGLAADSAEAWLTLKLAAPGIARHEFEYAIPPGDGLDLLHHCGSKLVKRRHGLNLPGGDWVLDVFEAGNAPLVIAEVELEREDQAVAIPPWCVREITGEGAFSNAALAGHPFGQWPLEERQPVLCSLAAVPPEPQS
ncbi:MAG: CYTH domain-containing protein [Cyanobacteria bacterium]|nr:CYTH domain-containing protein [Cyanobacteriota bacterium]